MNPDDVQVLFYCLVSLICGSVMAYSLWQLAKAIGEANKEKYHDEGLQKLYDDIQEFESEKDNS